MGLRKISVIALLAVAVGVMAVPARRDGFVRTAADGTEKMVWLHGNEDFHYMTDAEGNWLNEETLRPLTEEEKSEKLKVKSERIRKAAQQTMVGGEPNIAPRGLVILVNFKNQSFVTPYDTVDSMMNGENFTRKYDYSYTYKGKTYEGTITSSGSAAKYFRDQSYGQYNPVFDVVGPYTVSSNYEVYGKNGSSGSDSNVGQLIKEACELADQDGADFTLYDNDNDGYVDFVYVLYAGEGEADGGGANTIWPHNYRLTYWGKQCTVDGKQVDNYACSNEINHYGGSYAGIGTFVHEFGHVIGLPDLYETNNPQQGNHTLCDWDIMDYGPYNNDGNTPPGYSAYERFYCGWLTPRVLTDPEYVWLNPIELQEALLISSNDTHNLTGYDPYPTQFYLLEVRNKSGWDAYLPGEGMLITKINYKFTWWTGNTVNNTASNMGVDMMEATANTGSWGEATDAYPAGATQWTAMTNHEVTNIVRQPGGAITFSYRGGPATEVESIQSSEVSAQKRIVNGRVVIVRGNKTYDILGNENNKL